MAGRPALALTSGHVHGVEAGQQVTAPLAVSFHLAQPGVAVEVVAEVRPLHVGHDHAIQVPAGVQACVVVLDPGAEADTHTSLAEQRRHPFHTRIPRCSLQRGVPSFRSCGCVTPQASVSSSPKWEYRARSNHQQGHSTFHRKPRIAQDHLELPLPP